ncbi:MAG: glycosyltransferase family 4 protein [Alphaproteobacteria bacterium]|nr:glycosyltransferase family 4 protein [Alphaproteobacteria bacterium]
MRVLLVPNTAASMVWFRLPFLQALVARGHRAWVAAPEGTGVDRILATGVGFVPVFQSQGWALGGDASAKASYTDPFVDLAYVRDVHRICRVLRPDLVLAYTHKLTLLVPPAARAAGVRRVHGMVTGMGPAHLRGGPRQELTRQAFHATLRAASAALDSMIVLNRDNLDDVRRLALAPFCTPWLMDGEGVDTEAFDAPAPRPEAGRVTFLMVARLVRYKGVEVFAQAARRVKAQYPHARFVLVGGVDPNHPDAVPEATLQSWRDEGIVELPGFVSDMARVYADADVFVLPSDETEGLPMSIMEAMAMRRPILTTAVPGNRETVEDGVNGWRFAKGDVAGLAGHMQALLAAPERVTAMGEASRDRCVRRFDHRVVNAALLDHLGL